MLTFQATCLGKKKYSRFVDDENEATKKCTSTEDDAEAAAAIPVVKKVKTDLNEPSKEIREVFMFESGDPEKSALANKDGRKRRKRRLQATIDVFPILLYLLLVVCMGLLLWLKAEIVCQPGGSTHVNPLSL